MLLVLKKVIRMVEVGESKAQLAGCLKVLVGGLLEWNAGIQ